MTGCWITAWRRRRGSTLAPQAPLYLFVPQNVDFLAEYQQGWKVTRRLSGELVLGIVTST